MIGKGGSLLLATRNRGKSKEFREALQSIGISVKDLHDVEGVPDIEETGDTFAANALLKAKAVAELTGMPVLADDSGLCVDALGGAPGVYSARYAGEGAGDEANLLKVLAELEAMGVSVNGASTDPSLQPELLSSARFVCCLILYNPEDGSKLQAEGTIEGNILRQARGTSGFGYDPIFWVPSHSRSMAELTVEEKNEISHRGRALQRLLELL